MALGGDSKRDNVRRLLDAVATTKLVDRTALDHHFRALQLEVCSQTPQLLLQEARARIHRHDNDNTDDATAAADLDGWRWLALQLQRTRHNSRALAVLTAELEDYLHAAEAATDSCVSNSCDAIIVDVPEPCEEPRCEEPAPDPATKDSAARLRIAYLAVVGVPVGLLSLALAIVSWLLLLLPWRSDSNMFQAHVQLWLRVCTFLVAAPLSIILAVVTWPAAIAVEWHRQLTSGTVAGMLGLLFPRTQWSRSRPTTEPDSDNTNDEEATAAQGLGWGLRLISLAPALVLVLLWWPVALVRTRGSETFRHSLYTCQVACIHSVGGLLILVAGLLWFLVFTVPVLPVHALLWMRDTWEEWLANED